MSDMNVWMGIGRLVSDPKGQTVKSAKGDIEICNYTIAVNRRKAANGNDGGADFIRCTAFGKLAEVAEKWFHKGTKLWVRGHIQTGSYEKNGQKVYTWAVAVDEQQFDESRKEHEQNQQSNAPTGTTDADGFMSIPEGSGEEVPFS